MVPVLFWETAKSLPPNRPTDRSQAQQRSCEEDQQAPLLFHPASLFYVYVLGMIGMACN